KIMPAGQLITAADHRLVLAVDLFEGIDLGQIIGVGDDAAALRVGAGGKRGAVDLGGAAINGGMVLEHYAVLGELIQRWRVFFGDEIGPHSVPHDENDVFCFARREQKRWLKREKKPE